MSISSMLQSMQGSGATSMVVESGAGRRSSVSSVGVSILCSQSAVDSPAVSSKDIVSSESSILSTTASVRAVESSEGVSGSYGARSAYGGDTESGLTTPDSLRSEVMADFPEQAPSSSI
jgi:hypothetical protein